MVSFFDRQPAILHQPWQQVNAHRFGFQVNIQKDLLERRKQDFAPGGVFYHIHIIRAGLDNLSDHAQNRSGFVDHIQADDLVMIILAVRKRRSVVSPDVNGLGAIFRRLLSCGNPFKAQDQAIAMRAAAGNLKRQLFIPKIEICARFQALGEISDQVKQEIAVHTMRAAQGPNG